ncbi:MAG: ATP-binding cassette domain-containing protein [Rickettsiales bacterium]|jgi:ATPase subunit of ABC transporter with duplicated ATPase domains|nr:ATP-binding cassette domain-containing protein [Rickettsiales bacterium]
MLTINDLAFLYGAKLLFADVNLNLNKGQRIGLVGGNGAGKSTFLKLLAGEEEPSLGIINIAKRARVGWLKQDQFRYENVSIVNTVIAGNKVLWEAICEKEELLSKEVCDDKTGYRLGELEEIIFDNDGYNAEYIASELLSGLGIKEEYHHQPLSVLSGGYKLRVLLAQSLFDNPDILLLDEPTNHLDIISIYWLENYLRNTFKGLLIFISHDVTFVNNLATHILDIDYGEITQYTGNYCSFVEQKAAVMEQKQKELVFLEKKIATMKVFVEKFRASASRSKQALSREKQIDKIELPDVKKSSRISPNFYFRPKRPSGKLALNVKGISKTYKDRQILNNVNFSVSRGDKVIIIGPNGIGKSTLLKILLDKVTAESGDKEWGHEAHKSYFAQDHHELLNESISAYEWMCQQLPTETTSKLRNVLGHVLFKQDDAHKDVLQLSGGEGARLLLAKIMVEEGNCLILDEPTNHLDIEAKDGLKKALVEFPGTLIMVTHDRDFASGIATRIIAITEKNIIDYKGTYDEYLAKYGQDYFKY